MTLPADLTLVFDPEPYEAAVVDAGLDAFNRAQVGHEAELLACVRRTDADFDAGFAIQKVGDEAILFALWVAPERRRQRVGSRLLEAALAVAAAQGCRRMTCGVYGYQGPDFFKARGFQELGRVEDLADGNDYVFLRRRIVWSSDAEPLPLHPAGTVEVGALRRRIAPSHGGTEELNAVLRDAVRGPVGGVLARLDGAEAYVDVLWVDDAIRGFGHGARLMAGVEREAALRGAARVTVDTFDFQAPAFYRAQGYRPIATVPDFLAGHTRHYFRKELALA